MLHQQALVFNHKMLWPHISVFRLISVCRPLGRGLVASNLERAGEPGGRASFDVNRYGHEVAPRILRLDADAVSVSQPRVRGGRS